MNQAEQVEWLTERIAQTIELVADSYEREDPLWIVEKRRGAELAYRRALSSLFPEPIAREAHRRLDYSRSRPQSGYYDRRRPAPRAGRLRSLWKRLRRFLPGA